MTLQGRFRIYRSSTGPGLRGTWVENCSEHGSDRCETLPKRDSDDSGRFVFQRQKIFFGETFGSKISIFADLAWFWSSHGRTDLKISLLVEFCSRTTCREVCTSKKLRIRSRIRSEQHTGEQHTGSACARTISESKKLQVSFGQKVKRKSKSVFFTSTQSRTELKLR